jgi:maleylacetate reductase
MSLHHKLCHVIGGTFDLPHAPTHAVVPMSRRSICLRPPQAAAALGRALNTDDPARALAAVNVTLNNAPSLRSLGLQREDLVPAAENASAVPLYGGHRRSRAAVRAAAS